MKPQHVKIIITAVSMCFIRPLDGHILHRRHLDKPYSHGVLTLIVKQKEQVLSFIFSLLNFFRVLKDGDQTATEFTCRAEAMQKWTVAEDLIKMSKENL